MIGIADVRLGASAGLAGSRRARLPRKFQFAAGRPPSDRRKASSICLWLSIAFGGFIEMRDLREVFQVIVDCDNVAQGKPDPQCYHAAASQLGLSAADCLAFEDSMSGVQAGVAGGAICIGIGEDDDLANAGASAIFPDFDRVIELLRPDEETTLRFEHNRTAFVLRGIGR